ncbi:MAG: alpha-hydroxy acid oxidase [Deinococcales bacterium]
MDILNLLELEHAAKQQMQQTAFDYYVSGADDEITLRENREAYTRLKLNYRVLTGVGARKLETTLLGQRLSMPVIVAPAAFQRLAHDSGERATAAATQKAGTVMCLSTLSSTSLEEIRASQPDLPLWFQVYLYKDQALSRDLVARAKAVGAQALALTVDAPVWGRRERDIRNQFTLPKHIHLGNLMSGLDSLPSGRGSGLSAYVHEMFKLDLDYKDLEWLKAESGLPILVKGICHPKDAVLSLEHGADGIWVSNHGGRQLDTAPATIEVLPRVADAVAGRAPIIVDGGVRRGTDVVKALALGANAVAIGRPILWSLALGGEAAVTHTLELLRHEIDSALGLCGYGDLNVPKDLIFKP